MIDGYNYTWEVASSGWGYSHLEDVQSWYVIAHAKGTDGNLSMYCLARHYIDGKDDEEEVCFVENLVTGSDGYEELIETYNVA